MVFTAIRLFMQILGTVSKHTFKPYQENRTEKVDVEYIAYDIGFTEQCGTPLADIRIADEDSPGTHALRINSSDVPGGAVSGMYICTLPVGNFRLVSRRVTVH